MKKKIRKILERGVEFYKEELRRAKKKRLARKTLYPVGFEYKDRQKKGE
jgi:hypothetical protein|tara:strand:- start:122 stop:268 length:147 start_codon:yes stop_codon:yes gene_type:complete